MMHAIATDARDGINKQYSTDELVVAGYRTLSSALVNYNPDKSRAHFKSYLRDALRNFYTADIMTHRKDPIPTSLNKAIGDDGFELGDMVPAPESPPPYESDIIEKLHEELANMSPLRREVIKRAYGIDREAERKSSIAKSLGININQVVKELYLAKLRLSTAFGTENQESQTNTPRHI